MAGVESCAEACFELGIETCFETCVEARLGGAVQECHRCATRFMAMGWRDVRAPLSLSSPIPRVFRPAVFHLATLNDGNVNDFQGRLLGLAGSNARPRGS